MKPQMSCITWEFARYGSRVPYSNSWLKLNSSRFPKTGDGLSWVGLSLFCSRLPVAKLSWLLNVYGLLTWPNVSILGFPGGLGSGVGGC